MFQPQKTPDLSSGFKNHKKVFSKGLKSDENKILKNTSWSYYKWAQISH